MRGWSSTTEEWVGIKAAQNTWSSSTDPEASISSLVGLKNHTEYLSMAGVYRGFCSDCGSTLLWRCEKRARRSPNHDMHFGLKVVDRPTYWLRRVSSRTGGPGSREALWEPVAGHLWFENDVKGVTDRYRLVRNPSRARWTRVGMISQRNITGAETHYFDFIVHGGGFHCSSGVSFAIYWMGKCGKYFIAAIAPIPVALLAPWRLSIIQMSSYLTQGTDNTLAQTSLPAIKILS